jgi:hypothetical protein
VAEEARAKQTLALQDKETSVGHLATVEPQTMDRLYTTGQGDGVCDKAPLRSCFPQGASVDKPSDVG